MWAKGELHCYHIVSVLSSKMNFFNSAMMLNSVAVHMKIHMKACTLTLTVFYFSCFLFFLTDQSKAMLTELCLASDEFDHFDAQAHNSITFCLKELRVRLRTKSGIREWGD